MAETAPRPPFYERNIFWGFLSVAVGAVLAATGLLLPPTEVAKWLLVLGGILLFIASLIAIRELRSVVTRAASAATSFALITVGLLFLWSLRTVPSPEKTGSVSEKANALAPLPTPPIPQSSEKQPAPSVQRQIVAWRPYDLNGVRRTQFLKLLQQNEPRQTIRVGCLYWSESACVGAGQFLIALSEGGWNIDSGRVFRLDSLVPKAGVSIVSRTDPENANLPPQPPHLGKWHQMSESEVTLHFAFRSIGIPVNGSSENDLPEGTVGVYFGPEPENLLPISTSEKDTWKLQKEISKKK